MEEERGKNIAFLQERKITGSLEKWTDEQLREIVSDIRREGALSRLAKQANVQSARQ